MGKESIFHVGFVAGFWQCPLVDDAHGIFTYCHAKLTINAHTYSEGVLNRTTYSQAVIQRKVEELNAVMWLGGITMWGTNFDTLLRALDAIVGRLESEFCMQQPINVRYTIPVSSGVAKHYLERANGLAKIHRSEAKAELLQFQ